MSKLLLSCDDYIFLHKGKYYFKNSEWSDFYQRYLRVFSYLRIANRVVEEPELKEGRVLVDDSRIEIHYLPEFHGPMQYFIKYFSIGRAIKSVVEGCDAAILRLPSTVAQRLSRSVIKKGIPFATEIVFDAHDGAETADNIFEKFLWLIIDKEMRKICAQADGVSCVTEKYLQQHYYSKKSGSFVENYSTLNLDKTFYSSARTYPNKPVLSIAHVDMQIGLHSRKGTDILIQALSLLKAEGVVVNVSFAGDDRGNNKSEILSYAKKFGVEGQVSCPGYLSRSELSNFLDNSDLFVLPTKAEGLPRVLIEALAKGLPIVTTPVSGNPELVSPEYLVAFDDISCLAQKIKLIVSNKEVYEAASYENFQKSMQYEGSVLRERRDSFYKELNNLTAIEL